MRERWWSRNESPWARSSSSCNEVASKNAAARQEARLVRVHSPVTCHSQPGQRKRGVLQQLQIGPNQVNGLLGMSYNHRI